MKTLDRLRNVLASIGADSMLVSQPENVRCLSGFTGPQGAVVVITSDRTVFLSDAGHELQARNETSLEVDITADRDKRLSELVGNARMAFEANHVTVSALRALNGKLKAEPIATEGNVEGMRLVKSDEEVALLREAARITDRAFAHVQTITRAGTTEVRVSQDLERWIRLAGAISAGDVTVSSGIRSAAPRIAPSARPLQQGELVTLGFGAVVQGYHTHLTRSVVMGTLTLRHLLDLATAAQAAAVAAVGQGVYAREVYGAARDVLERHDLADAILEPVGHGTGLRSREARTLAADSSEVLAPGMVMTVGPGVYLPGVGGARVDEVLIVTERGGDSLSEALNRPAST